MNYTKPVKYTQDDLFKARIADLETDIRCAERDGLPDYAEACKRLLAELKASRSTKATQ